MDDTMCNFIKAFRMATLKEPGIQWPQSQYGFFANLEPVPGAIEAYKTLETKYKVFTLTRPSIYNPLSYTEKRVWIEKHLGFNACEDLILCPDKTVIRGDYLIDDMPQNGHFKPEWEQIYFGSQAFPDWESVLKYLM